MAFLILVFHALVFLLFVLAVVVLLITMVQYWYITLLIAYFPAKYYIKKRRSHRAAA